ncbi:MAG: hypothetical protein H6Q64_1611 [Firmicutes bacterium]|nr:hypothetical protein [Bacillota bacterium]
MLMLLKLACFALWLAMMMRLILAGQSENGERYPVMLRLIDPEQAEYEVKSALHYLMPQAQLYLEISCQNPCWPELLFIACCLQRTNPSIIISTESTENSLAQL